MIDIIGKPKMTDKKCSCGNFLYCTLAEDDQEGLFYIWDCNKYNYVHFESL